MGAREQGSKGAEIYHMTIISNQELGAREKGSRTISKNLFSIQPWTYWVTQKLPQTKITQPCHKILQLIEI